MDIAIKISHNVLVPHYVLENIGISDIGKSLLDQKLTQKLADCQLLTFEV